MSRSISTPKIFCMQPMYRCPCSSYAYTNGHDRSRHADGYTTLSQWTSQRRHSISSCGRSGSSVTASGRRGVSSIPVILAEISTEPQDLTNAAFSACRNRCLQSARDVEHVHLRERLEVGLAALGMLVGPEPERLDGAHPGPCRPEHVLVEPVADEERPLGLDAEPLERRLEDLGMRLAVAELGG